MHLAPPPQPRPVKEGDRGYGDHIERREARSEATVKQIAGRKIRCHRVDDQDAASEKEREDRQAGHAHEPVPLVASAMDGPALDCEQSNPQRRAESVDMKGDARARQD